MVVIVFGLPGSGKSYFASRLAGMMQACYLSTDGLRKKMLEERTYSEEEKFSVYREMLLRAEEATKQNRTIILDGTFYRKEIRQLFIEAFKNAPGIALIEVQASEADIKKRVQQPRPESDADFEVYKKVKAQWEPSAEPHLTLLSADGNIYDMLNKAAAYLQTQK